MTEASTVFMQEVLHLKNGKIVQEEVPSDWIQCKYSKEYRPPEEFKLDTQKYKSRDVCTSIHELPKAQQFKILDETSELLINLNYARAKGDFELSKHWKNATTIKEMIEYLKGFPQDAKVTTPEEYYFPRKPVLHESVQVDGKMTYVIGSE